MGLVMLPGIAGAQQAGSACALLAQPGESSEALIARAHALEGGCYRDPDFLFAFGQLLSSAGLYDLAVDRLEGVLMRRPGHWPARIEYAIALEGAGDRSSADALLAQLELDPALPEGVRLELQIRRKRWQGQASAATRLLWRQSLTLLAGYDNNLLGGPRVTSLTLTTPDANLPVALDPSNHPREGAFSRLDWRQDLRRVNQDGSYWNTALAANLRYAPGNVGADFSLLGLGVERVAPAQHGGYFQFSVQNLSTRSGSIYRYAGAVAAWDMAHQAYRCRSRLGGELQYRYYPGNLLLNGEYAGLLAQVACPESGWAFRVRSGVDSAEYHERPGGHQARFGMHLGKTTAWGQHQLSLDFDYELQYDQRGFSPLLENYLRRKVNKSVYRIEYVYLTRDLEPIAGVEWLDQRSNLSLYRTDTLMAYIGLRWVW